MLTKNLSVYYYFKIIIIELQSAPAHQVIGILLTQNQLSAFSKKIFNVLLSTIENRLLKTFQILLCTLICLTTHYYRLS